MLWTPFGVFMNPSEAFLSFRIYLWNQSHEPNQPFSDPFGNYTGPCKDNNKFVIIKHCLCFSFLALWNLFNQVMLQTIYIKI